MSKEIKGKPKGGRMSMSSEGEPRTMSRGLFWTEGEIEKIKRVAEVRGLSQAETVRQAFLEQYEADYSK